MTNRRGLIEVKFDGSLTDFEDALIVDEHDKDHTIASSFDQDAIKNRLK